MSSSVHYGQKGSLQIEDLPKKGVNLRLLFASAKSSLAADGEAAPVFIIAQIDGANTTGWEIVLHMMSGAAIRIHVSGNPTFGDVADAVVESQNEDPTGTCERMHLVLGGVSLTPWDCRMHVADYEDRGDG